MKTRLFLEGIPKPKQRPRWSGKFMYSPKTSWEKDIKEQLSKQCFYYEDPIKVDMCFYMPRPKKHYRTGKYSSILKDDAPYYHYQKPDRDNLDKAVLDVLTDCGLLKDDCIVCDGSVTKLWANEKSGVYIYISNIEDSA